MKWNAMVESARPRLRVFLPIAVLAVTVIIAFIVGRALAGNLGTPQAPKLFRLVAGLSNTTGQLNRDTIALNQQVSPIVSSVSQLPKQEKILSAQLQTGSALSSALQTQITDTSEDVRLMQKILGAETQSVNGTNALLTESNQMVQVLGENEQVLQELNGKMQDSVSLTGDINGQMPALLSQLNSSEQEFQIFGQVNNILKDPLKSSIGPILKGVGVTQIPVIGGVQVPILGTLP